MQMCFNTSTFSLRHTTECVSELCVSGCKVSAAAVRWDSLANLSATVNLHSAIKGVRLSICVPVVIKM